MLVLNRKIGEYVVIGDEIIVKVVDINNTGLRLAIEAPREIPVMRGELYEENMAKKQNIKAV